MVGDTRTDGSQEAVKFPVVIKLSKLSECCVESIVLMVGQLISEFRLCLNPSTVK